MFLNNEMKDYFDSAISKKYDDSYEFNRWFSSPSLCLDYYMTGKSILERIKCLKFEKCLELGPGPGTWTKFIYRSSPGASFDLVDISEEMKMQFFLEMRSVSNVNYFVEDITSFDTNKKYDFFFSSRAIEYLDNKLIVFKKIYSLLDKKAKCIVITKNPVKKNKRLQHQGQISPVDLEKELNDIGFVNIKIYPVIIRIPFLNKFIPKFTLFIFNKIFKKNFKQINHFFSRFIESYLIEFDKHEN
ncbi:MAG TPA: class I SAM-dependent methyltransferase [bacterium]|nr:class I SAM-dependent methyltransferase [bacterium]